MDKNNFELRDLFKGAKDTQLDAYFLSMRDLVIRSPFSDSGTQQIQEIISELNRFHDSGSSDSIADVLERLFKEESWKQLLVVILVDGCNVKIKDEFKGKIKPLDIEQPGTSKHFQSFAEAMQEVVRSRYFGE